MAVRNFQCRYKIYTKKEIDKIIDDLDIDLTNYYDKSEIDTKLADKQNVLTAGTNISISEENIISATGGTEYTAGNNIQISEQNVISATDTVYTAGTGITIDANNVISASGGGGGSWTLRDSSITSWSDLFQVDNVSNIVAKKDIIILTKSPITFLAYIPKNFTGTKIRFANNVNILNGNNLRIVNTYEIEGTDIGGQNIGLSATSFTIDFDNKTLTSSSGTMSRTAQKTDFIIYTKD